jgi:hypothetical protein
MERQPTSRIQRNWAGLCVVVQDFGFSGERAGFQRLPGGIAGRFGRRGRIGCARGTGRRLVGFGLVFGYRREQGRRGDGLDDAVENDDHGAQGETGGGFFEMALSSRMALSPRFAICAR